MTNVWIDGLLMNAKRLVHNVEHQSPQNKSSSKISSHFPSLSPHFYRKLYLMEPLCQTQIPAGGHDSSELLHRLETQETKLLESDQRCRKISHDLQKVNIFFFFIDYSLDIFL